MTGVRKSVHAYRSVAARHANSFNIPRCIIVRIAQLVVVIHIGIRAHPLAAFLTFASPRLTHDSPSLTPTHLHLTRCCLDSCRLVLTMTTIAGHLMRWLQLGLPPQMSSGAARPPSVQGQWRSHFSSYMFFLSCRSPSPLCPSFHAKSVVFRSIGTSLFADIILCPAGGLCLSNHSLHPQLSPSPAACCLVCCDHRHHGGQEGAV